MSRPLCLRISMRPVVGDGPTQRKSGFWLAKMSAVALLAAAGLTAISPETARAGSECLVDTDDDGGSNGAAGANAGGDARNTACGPAADANGVDAVNTAFGNEADASGELGPKHRNRQRSRRAWQQQSQHRHRYRR